MATKRSSKASKSSKNPSKRIPSVKKLGSVRPLQMSLIPACSMGCGGTCTGATH
jgi:hypothetical protein